MSTVDDVVSDLTSDLESHLCELSDFEAAAVLMKLQVFCERRLATLRVSDK